MKRLFFHLTLPLRYVYYFLQPGRILVTVRDAYFNSFGGRSSADRLDTDLLFWTNLHLLFLGCVLLAALHFGLPFLGGRFHTESAIRVALGFITAFIGYAAIANLPARLRGSTDSSSTSSNLTSFLLFCCVPGALTGALFTGLTGDMLLGTLIAGIEMALVPLSFVRLPLGLEAPYGCIYGTIISTIGLTLACFHTPVRAWFTEAGSALLIALVLALVLVLLIFGLLRPIRNRSQQAKDLLLLVTLPLTLYGLSFAMQQLAGTLHLPAPSKRAIALSCFLVIFRLPLWPLEALWALLRFRALLAHAIKLGQQLAPYQDPFDDIDRKTAPYRRALRSAFFDRRTLLLLPGEQAALLKLAEIDAEMAIGEALDLLRFTSRGSTALAVILRITSHDPLGAYTPIKSFQRANAGYRVDTWLSSVLPAGASHLWQALTLVDELTPPVPAPSAVAKPQTTGPEGMQEFLVQASSKLRSALEHLEAAACETTPLRGTKLLRSFLSQTLRELNKQDAFTIAPIEFEEESFRELMNSIHTEQTYKWAIQRADNENWLARSMHSMANVTSVSQRRAHLLRNAGQLFGPMWAFGLSMKSLLRERAPGLWVLHQCFGILSIHWQCLIAAAAEQLAQQQPVGPVQSPFLLGPPVHGSLFLGRQPILDQLRSLWGEQPQWQSVLLHGHRRMGKSSILHNLPVLLKDCNVAIVNLSMQELGKLSGPIDFLRPLARKIFRATRDRFQGLSAVSLDLFDKCGPYEAFAEFIQLLADRRTNCRLLIAIDEYEGIDDMLKAGSIETYLLKFLRSQIDTHPWLNFAFAGLHTHNELDQEHWQQLFRTVLPIQVSFLSPQHSVQLLTQPTEDFPISYETSVLDGACHLTAGQPFLLQLIGQSLLVRINERRRHQPNAPLLATGADLREILDDPEFYSQGAPYFDGVMRQIRDDQPEATQLLDVLSTHPNDAAPDALAARVSLPPAQFKAACELLVRHQVLRRQADGRLGFSVPLMQMYCQRRQNKAQEPARSMVR